MTILRLSAQPPASINARPNGAHERVRSEPPLRLWQDSKNPSGKTMSRCMQLATDHWDPVRGATGGGFNGSPCHRPHGAAARLLRAFVRWQIRRLERRLAMLELDEGSPH